MSTDGDAWSCPDCYETVRGTPGARAAAQRVHGADHGRDRRVQAARIAQAEIDRVEERAARRRAAHARKLRRQSRGARDGR